jgi:GntR family transcriptional regulator
MMTDGPQPKHAQLRAELTKTIDEELEPGAMIPSERELTSRYGVSRATVRAAIGALVSEGRLTTVPGRGTVVTRPRVESTLHLASFTQDMRSRGHRPSTVVLSCAIVPADEATAVALDLAVGDRVWEIVRVRLADGQPMAHETSRYPEALVPALDGEDLTGSAYAVLESAYGIVITDAHQTVWTEQAGSYADLLEVDETAPVMVFDRIGSSGEGPVERTVSRYRGDRYQLSMSLRRRPSAH